MDPVSLHTYDQQVSYQYINEYNGSEEQISKILYLRKFIDDGKDMFDLMFNSIGKPDNIDLVNMYSIDRLLYDLACLIDDIDIRLLEEQLIDMRTGTCPEGRSLRLIQIIQVRKNRDHDGPNDTTIDVDGEFDANPGTGNIGETNIAIASPNITC